MRYGLMSYGVPLRLMGHCCVGVVDPTRAFPVWRRLSGRGRSDTRDEQRGRAEERCRYLAHVYLLSAWCQDDALVPAVGAT